METARASSNNAKTSKRERGKSRIEGNQGKEEAKVLVGRFCEEEEAGFTHVAAFSSPSPFHRNENDITFFPFLFFYN